MRVGMKVTVMDVNKPREWAATWRYGSPVRRSGGPRVQLEVSRGAHGTPQVQLSRTHGRRFWGGSHGDDHGVGVEANDGLGDQGRQRGGRRGTRYVRRRELTANVHLRRVLALISRGGKQSKIKIKQKRRYY